jgi:hypothetical protein
MKFIGSAKTGSPSKPLRENAVEILELKEETA